MPEEIETGVEPITTELQDSLDQTKERVMSSNNANEIYEHIKGLGNDPLHRERWVWELMQNAQDVAREEGVAVDIIYDGNEVTFTHNGTAFTEEDITHLIYHGSSKPGVAGKTGKFGTGFMTTHLLSKQVQVSGSLDDGRSFDFKLDRRAVSGKNMLTALDESWRDFKSSIQLNNPKEKTSFRYLEVEQSGGLDAVETVLASLPRLLPPVMVISGIIKHVTVSDRGHICQYHVSEGELEGEVKVERSALEAVDKPEVTLMIVKTLPGNKTKIVVPLNEHRAIRPIESNTARLFITFPLVGTDKAFPWPFLVHSEDFEPVPERDKIWIKSQVDTDQTKANKSVLQSALQAYYELCVQLAVPESQYKDLHLLANFGKVPNVDWLDTDWYKTTLSEQFTKFDDLLLIDSCIPAGKLPLKASIIPFLPIVQEGSEIYKDLWQLWYHLDKPKVPIFEQSAYWLNLIKDRASYQESGNHYTARDLRKVCIDIDGITDHKLDNLKVYEVLPEGFIAKLIGVIEKFSHQTLWAEYHILASQSRELCKSGPLFRESQEAGETISDTLKEISYNLDLKVKAFLLADYITISSKDHQLTVYLRSSLIANLVQKVKSAVLTEKGEIYQKNVKLLLEWLLQHRQTAEIVGYPILMHSEKWEKVQVSDTPFLVPLIIWPLYFQPYFDLFPKDFLVSSSYNFIFEQEDILAYAVSQKWFLASPLFSVKEILNQETCRKLAAKREDRERISENETGEWVMEEDVTVSQVAFFSSPKDKNLIDRARSSVKSTRLLLQMIVDVLLREDQVGFRKTPVTLKSGSRIESIEIYPADWLVDVKNRDWIKETGNNNYANRPSVDSLQSYFNVDQDNKVLYLSLQRMEVSRFLHFLDVAVGDLLRNIRSGDDEDEKISWDQSYVSILMNEHLTPSKVTEILADQELISLFERKKVEAEIRRENQQIGTDVENAFREAFENQAGYSIDRRPIGSDFVLECDTDHYLLLNRPDKKQFLVEIKSSRAAQVKMTVTQGAKAVEEQENYILCVVPLNGEPITAEYVKGAAKFVTDIAGLLVNKVTCVNEINKLKGDATIATVNEQIWTDIEGMNVRYVVGQQIWGRPAPKVFTFDDFVKKDLLKNI